MSFNGKGLIIFCSILVLSFMAAASVATPTLSLSFYKDNGYGMGGDMQGDWTINPSVSSDVTYVEFYLDGQLQKNATTAPFSWSFNTGNYTEGQHTFRVLAYNSVGEVAESEKRANFVGFPLAFVIGIIATIVAVTAAAVVVSVYRIRKQEAKKRQAYS